MFYRLVKKGCIPSKQKNIGGILGGFPLLSDEHFLKFSQSVFQKESQENLQGSRHLPQKFMIVPVERDSSKRCNQTDTVLLFVKA